MEFRLLGPLEVRGDDGARRSQLGGKRPRAAARACCCSTPNEAVSTDRLIDGIWGESPPPAPRRRPGPRPRAPEGARHRPHRHARARLPRPRRARASWTSRRFERLVALGETTLRDALALWRGPALADLAVRAVRPRPKPRGSTRARLVGARGADRRTTSPAGRRHGRRRRARSPRCGAPPPRAPPGAKRMLALYRAGPAGGRPRRLPRSAAQRSTSSASSPSPGAARRSSGESSSTTRRRPRPPRRGRAPGRRRRRTLIGRDLELAAVGALLRR